MISRPPFLDIQDTFGKGYSGDECCGLHLSNTKLKLVRAEIVLDEVKRKEADGARINLYSGSFSNSRKLRGGFQRYLICFEDSLMIHTIPSDMKASDHMKSSSLLRILGGEVSNDRKVSFLPCECSLEPRLYLRLVTEFWTRSLYLLHCWRITSFSIGNGHIVPTKGLSKDYPHL